MDTGALQVVQGVGRSDMFSIECTLDGAALHGTSTRKVQPGIMDTGCTTVEGCGCKRLQELECRASSRLSKQQGSLLLPKGQDNEKSLLQFKATTKGCCVFGATKFKRTNAMVQPWLEVHMPHLPKKSANFWASSVALVTMRRKSLRRRTTCQTQGRNGRVGVSV